MCYPQDSFDIVKDSEFYLLFGPTLLDKEFLPESERPSWRLAQLVGQRKITLETRLLPKVIQGWTEYSLVASIEELSKCATDITVKKNTFQKIPDVWKWLPFYMVSKRFRDVINDFDPDGSYFLPCRLEARETYQKSPTEYFHWIPRRKFVRGKGIPEFKGQSPLIDIRAKGALFHDFARNTNIRKIMAAYPVFSFLEEQIVLRRDLFLELKKQKLSGLIEVKGNDGKAGEVVGHA